MQKNWYAVYTRPNCEKKVANVLSKWKIESFCPCIRTKSTVMTRTRIQLEPLFKSYVFLYTPEDKMSRISRINGVVNFLHWLGKPAVINEEEIETIREFAGNYKDIRLERIQVNMHDGVKILGEPSYKREGKFISIKTMATRVDLPSLGYTIIAEIEKESVRERQNSLFNSSSMSHENLKAV